MDEFVPAFDLAQRPDVRRRSRLDVNESVFIQDPTSADAVAIKAGVDVRLVGHKTSGVQHEVWVWEAADGRGFVTKRWVGRQDGSRRPFWWALQPPNDSAQTFLRNNRIERIARWPE